MKTFDLLELLQNNPYPGRGIVLGRSADNKISKSFFHVFQAPFNSEEMALISAVIIQWNGTNSNSFLRSAPIFCISTRSVWMVENCTKATALYPVISTCIAAQDIV